MLNKPVLGKLRLDCSLSFDDNLELMNIWYTMGRGWR